MTVSAVSDCADKEGHPTHARRLFESVGAVSPEADALGNVICLVEAVLAPDVLALAVVGLLGAQQFAGVVVVYLHLQARGRVAVVVRAHEPRVRVRVRAAGHPYAATAAALHRNRACTATILLG